MKKTALAFIMSIIVYNVIISQTTDIQGKALAEIYSDFHYNLRGGTNTTGFSLNRAYIGYNFSTSENFSALIRVEIGTPDDLATGSKSRRYAYYRDASISYSNNKFNLTLGITGTRLFDYQQKFWGKRYLANTFHSLNNYGFVADLGIVADYKFNDIVEIDVTVMNGEGYSSLQLDNDLKSSVGITITPLKEFVIRAYSDIMKNHGLWQTTVVGFAGYRNERLTIGTEMSFKSNLDLTMGHHAWGISGTGAVNLTKKLEVFTRYDYSTSVIAQGDVNPWNHAKDGSFLITGFQYTFNKFVKLALDNQAIFHAAQSKSFSDMIFVNALFKF